MVIKVASFDIGTRNFAMCIVEHDPPLQPRVVRWTLEDLYPRPRVLHNATSVLYEHLDELACCHVILVEKQLTNKNYEAARMAQHVLSWFAIVLPDVKTVHYHAHHKTSFFAPQQGPKRARAAATAATASRDKRDRKKFCISLAIEFLAATQQDKALAQLLTSAKKDDLADTLCQALSYLKVDV